VSLLFLDYQNDLVKHLIVFATLAAHHNVLVVPLITDAWKAAGARTRSRASEWFAVFFK
jgi:hypothetical protein